MDVRAFNRRVVPPLLGSGLLMAAYLLLRPYGDADGLGVGAADAFASPLWVAAHVCGAAALTLSVVVAHMVGGAAARGVGRFARVSGVLGIAMVLPYYGAETFGLHAIGTAAQADPALVNLADDVRNQPVAITLFGIGLLLLAGCALTTARAWQVSPSPAPRAAWAYGLLFALLLPQFYLPPTGRMAYGVMCAVAAAGWALAVRRTTRADAGAVPMARGKQPSTLRVG